MVLLIGYGLAAIVAGILLTVLVSLFHPMKKVDDFKPVRWIIALSLVSAAAPYIWCEYETKKHGPDFANFAKNAITVAGVNGQLEYYKIIWVGDRTARMAVIAKEKSNWGGHIERTVINVELERKESGWAKKKYEIVNSFSRSLDYSTFPPYF